MKAADKIAALKTLRKEFDRATVQNDKAAARQKASKQKMLDVTAKMTALVDSLPSSDRALYAEKLSKILVW